MVPHVWVYFTSLDVTGNPILLSAAAWSPPRSNRSGLAGAGHAHPWIRSYSRPGLISLRGQSGWLAVDEAEDYSLDIDTNVIHHPCARG